MSKKANNEGNIRLRKDNRWEARITLGNGKRKSYFAKTREEAHAKLLQGQQSLALGVDLSGDNIKFTEFSTEWLEAKRPNVEVKTFRTYSDLLSKHILPVFSKLPLNKIKVRDVESLYQGLTKKGLSPTSVGHIASVLYNIFALAVKWELVISNPCEYADRPKLKKHTPIIWSEEQVGTFLSTTTGSPFEALFDVLVASMCRINEALALCWSDIDFKENKISITKNLKLDENGRLISGSTKTDNSNRVITVPQRVIDKLAQHRLSQMKHYQSLEGYGDKKLVFASKLGTFLSHQNIDKRIFKPLLKEAGLNVKTRLHDLRHIGASICLKNAVPVTTVSEFLGHSSPAVTMNIYSHSIPKSEKILVGVMDKVMEIKVV